MNLENYKNFVAIIDEGTILAASKKLLIAQPALTNQLKSMEELYGAQLVIRKPRKIELTDAGRILYDKIKTICYLEDAAKKEIKACVDGCRGTLRFGCTPRNLDMFLCRILLDFHAAYPDISFHVYERNSEQLLDLVESGVIEIALVRAQTNLLSHHIQPIVDIKEHLMVYFHKDHPVLSPDMDKVSLLLLRDLPISTSVGLKKYFTEACQNEGFYPNYMSISMSHDLSKLWAADKKTVSIIAHTDYIDMEDYCTKDLLIEGVDLKKLFVVNKSLRLSAVAQTFADFCKNHPLVIELMKTEKKKEDSVI